MYVLSRPNDKMEVMVAPRSRVIGGIRVSGKRKRDQNEARVIEVDEEDSDHEGGKKGRKCP